MSSVVNRRAYVAVVASTISGVGGCLSSGSDDYETREYGDHAVPLAPIDDVYEWYEDDAVVVVDARSAAQYERAHVAGAALSPAPAGFDDDDPTADLSDDERVVTYCDCPHSLAVQRAAALLDDGFEDVYALDEGFPEWQDRGYPVDGNDSQESIPVYEVRGWVDAAYAGEYVRLEEPTTEQREFGRIDDDGRFELAARFVDVDEGTEVILRTPDGTRRGTLDELTGDEISI